ncbi:thioredoxin domain-containing protein [Conexibacter sp. DBS9H8]|uniref:thioredoxin domain-containing protein n=1 Tax=Conexibacter sp. DBS9H8 TaxID=2937801 RepID=UPI00200CB961|nr:thioredoxin domain-containing protein [Conexibacter sp. DBS9H8]
MTNALAQESSPYLRQHAANPVDWVPWSPGVLERARALGRPVLVSIGYSACHWCHVMAHECFEDPEIAALMNAELICVKVDREERPDLDAVCMDACQRLTGHGGWPLNVFLTPDGEPFFAGTYFPPEPRHGQASWPMILTAIAEAWRDRPAAVRDQARRLSSAISAAAVPLGAGGPVLTEALTDAVQRLAAGFDHRHGGWGDAPKFPPHCALEFLLSRAAQNVPDAGPAREMALDTLGAMAAGGIFDQVGGGFHRYTVDATWTVPHFEKMLYDNALLARAYLHGFQLSGEPRLREVCEATLDFCLAELRRPDGTFGSALDADSDGAEGTFYVWTLTELEGVLGDDPELCVAAVDFFGVTAEGNFEGANVLEGHGPVPARLDEIRTRLCAARAGRVRPGFDEKAICAWNALMIAALAEAGAVLSRPDYLAAARRCAAALLPAVGAEAELRRTGVIPAFLDDYAYLVEALTVLYEATWEPRWYRAAVALADTMIERFGDRGGPAGKAGPEARRERTGEGEGGGHPSGFFTTPVGHEELIGRRHDLEDTPIPSGSSAAALGLLRLSRLSGAHLHQRWGDSVLAAHGPIAVRHPAACGHLLRALDLALAADVAEVAIVGEGPDGPLARTVRARLRPHVVLAGAREPVGGASAGSGADGGMPVDAGGIEASVPLLLGRGPLSTGAAAYVCEHFSCHTPVGDPAALVAQLER